MVLCHLDCYKKYITPILLMNSTLVIFHQHLVTILNELSNTNQIVLHTGEKKCILYLLLTLLGLDHDRFFTHYGNAFIISNLNFILKILVNERKINILYHSFGCYNCYLGTISYFRITFFTNVTHDEVYGTR